MREEFAPGNGSATPESVDSDQQTTTTRFKRRRKRKPEPSPLKFETLEPRLLLSADIIPIQGAIDLPGEVDKYEFTLAQPKTLYVDSLKLVSINWSISDSSGTEIA